MPATSEGLRPHRIGDHLAIECWCRTSIGYVDRHEVLAGRTFSCGPDCEPT